MHLAKRPRVKTRKPATVKTEKKGSKCPIFLKNKYTVCVVIAKYNANVCL